MESVSVAPTAPKLLFPWFWFLLTRQGRFCPVNVMLKICPKMPSVPWHVRAARVGPQLLAWRVCIISSLPSQGAHWQSVVCLQCAAFGRMAAAIMHILVMVAQLLRVSTYFPNCATCPSCHQALHGSQLPCMCTQVGFGKIPRYSGPQLPRR